MDFENIEEIGRDASAFQTERLAPIGEADALVVVRGEIDKRREPLPEKLKARVRKAVPAGTLAVPECEQASGIGIGERLQQDRADDREDRGVSADGQDQGQSDG